MKKHWAELACRVAFVLALGAALVCCCQTASRVATESVKAIREANSLDELEERSRELDEVMRKIDERRAANPEAE